VLRQGREGPKRFISGGVDGCSALHLWPGAEKEYDGFDRATQPENGIMNRNGTMKGKRSITRHNWQILTALHIMT
jgi:hypothetical protein